MSELSPTDSATEIERNGLVGSESAISAETIDVLVVDDNPDMADLTATYLTREKDAFSVRKELSVSDALPHLSEVDAIVSDYEMPDQDGLDFLTIVRETHPELPFILFTGRGSETIASEAISKGVTDYLQKKSGSSNYSVLANRINNTVQRHRAMKMLQRSERRFSNLVKNSSDVISVVNENAQFVYLSPSAEEILGYHPDELLGEYIFTYAHPDDRQDAMEQFFLSTEDPEIEPVVQFRFKDPEGTWPVLESRGQNLLDDDFVNGFVINSRDISEIKTREQKLEQQNEKLHNIKKTLSHDIRNPLNVATGSLELFESSREDEHLETTKRALTRIDTLVEQILNISEQSPENLSDDEISLEDVAVNAWSMIPTEDSTLNVNDSRHFTADQSRLQQVFENLFSNAIDHNSESVTISVGTIDSGIYIQDDGAGIDPDRQDVIFDPGYTTGAHKTGFGLAIVEQIALSHGWDIAVTASDNGGARFEITGITFQPVVCE